MVYRTPEKRQLRLVIPSAETSAAALAAGIRELAFQSDWITIERLGPPPTEPLQWVPRPRPSLAA